MPDYCVQCQQSCPKIDVDLLRIQHELSFRGSKTPSWTIVRQQYCQLAIAKPNRSNSGENSPDGGWLCYP